jgi:beta-lactamase regulating signal transducer with metallopeptidase domain
MPLQLVRSVLALVHWADSLVDWLVTYALHSTILIAAVWLLAAGPLGRRLRLTNAAWLWLAALCGGLVTATLQTSGALAPAAGTLRLAADASTRASVRVAFAAKTDAPMHSPAAPSPPRTMAATIDLRPRWPLALVLGWMTGALIMLGGFGVARWRFLRSLAGRRSAEFTLAGSALREICRRTGVRRPIRLTVAEGLASPVAIGRHEICIPERALVELDLAQQEGMLAHELAHLERSDSRWLFVARVVEAVFFFQPLNRLARRRMQDAAEFAADAWALRALARPVALARCLARVAEWSMVSQRLLAPAMSGRRGSMLLQRVERLTSGRASSEQGAGPVAGMLVCGALFALALLAPRAAVGAPAGPPIRGLRGENTVRVVRLRPPDGVGRLGFRGPSQQDVVVFRLRAAVEETPLAR